MSPVTAIVGELVAAGLAGADLVAAIGRLEAAGAFAVTIVGGAMLDARRGRPGDPESAGARRTRAWRARRAGRVTVTAFVTHGDADGVAAETAQAPAIPGLSAAMPGAGGVTNRAAASPVRPIVTDCDAAAEKEVPPHPPKKNHLTPQTPLPRQRRHNGNGRQRRTNPFADGTPLADPPPKVLRDTPLFLELKWMAEREGRTIPDHGDGWWWSRTEIARAEARLAERVTVLPVRTVSVPAAEPADASQGFGLGVAGGVR